MDPRTTRPKPTEYAEFYARYVSHVPAGDIVRILATQLEATLAPLRSLSEAEAERGYAPGKWSIKQVLGHIADAERVFGVRALRFARGDATPLPGFDQDPYVEAGAFDARPLASLLNELTAVRAATVALFDSLAPEAWLREGVASTFPVSVRALAHIAAGHELHHRAILAERYGIGYPAQNAQAQDSHAPEHEKRVLP